MARFAVNIFDYKKRLMVVLEIPVHDRNQNTIRDVLQKALIVTHRDGLAARRIHKYWIKRVYKEWLSEAWEVLIVDVDRSLLYQFFGDGTLNAKGWRQEGAPHPFNLDDALSTK